MVPYKMQLPIGVECVPLAPASGTAPRCCTAADLFCRPAKKITDKKRERATSRPCCFKAGHLSFFLFLSYLADLRKLTKRKKTRARWFHAACSSPSARSASLCSARDSTRFCSAAAKFPSQGTFSSSEESYRQTYGMHVQQTTLFQRCEAFLFLVPLRYKRVRCDTRVSETIHKNMQLPMGAECVPLQRQGQHLALVPRPQKLLPEIFFFERRKKVTYRPPGRTTSRAPCFSAAKLSFFCSFPTITIATGAPPIHSAVRGRGCSADKAVLFRPFLCSSLHTPKAGQPARESPL